MNQTELRHILSAKFDFDVWKELLNTLFPKVELFNKEVQVDASLIKQGGHVGNVRLDDGRSLAIFKFEVADSVQVSRNRRGLRDIAAKYVDQSLIHGALVFYHSLNQEDYRLTYVAKQTVFDESGQFKTNETAPKRYTFILGPNETCTTAANRLFELAERKRKKDSIYLADVTEAFSVERLNKEFFDGYKKQYNKFLATLSDGKQNRDYVKKLLGRIVFLHFLQKKGWMGVPAFNPGWEGGDRNYLANLVSRYNDNDRLLSDVLEPLFFNTLNEKRENDIADSILGDNIKIPYLNGGLFEKDSIDRLDIDFPYSYFKELMEFFSMYNFTIDENDPDDSEVGIDPEMLGHIFENLLEDNKDKGAFYTPKEIVHYMSKESVAQYLKNNTPDELHTAIDSLIKQRVVEPILQKKENARIVSKALTNIKVCDPAIGSGAFPMGVLNVLFDCRHLLYGFIGVNEVFSYAKVKRDIIQNNIYGVDIEQGAVDIARLRFWLALVVDENEPQPLPNLDYKIMCGNSLLHRFALDTPFKSVLRDYNQKNGTKYTIDDYRQWVYDYTNISDHTQKDDFRKKIEDIKHAVKTELSDNEKGKISKVRGTIDNLQMEDVFGGKNKETEKKIKELKKKLAELEKQREEIESNKIYKEAFEWRFEFPQLLDNDGNFTGFDIVIGNPPYVNVQLMSTEEKKIYRANYTTFFKRCDMFCLFYELGLLKITSSKGIVTMIIPSVIHSNMSYKLIRNVMLDNQWLQEVRYTGGDVFNAPTVDTTILICNKKGNNSIVLTDAVDFANPQSHTVPADYFKKYDNVISIGDNKESGIFDKLFCQDYDILGNNYTVFQGIVTGNNPAFVFDTEEDAISHDVDKTLLHPLCHGRDLEKYHVRSRERRILYIDNDINIDNHPKTKSWLLNFKDALSNRREAKRGVIDWYGLQWPRVKSELDIKKKILVQRTRNESLKTRIVAALDKNGVYGMEGIYFITPKHNEASLPFLLGILNSKLINYLFATKFLNLAIKAEYLKQIRIPVPTPSHKIQIENLVQEIMQDKNENKETLQKEIQIDQLVYQLYDLTYDEVLIVDPETQITREEYESNI